MNCVGRPIREYCTLEPPVSWRQIRRSVIWRLAIIFGFIWLSQSACSLSQPGVPTSTNLPPPIRDLYASSENDIWIVTDKGKLKQLELSNVNVNTLTESVVDMLPAIQKISFLGRDYGWALDVDGYVWKTQNGGANWTKLSLVNDVSRVGSRANQIIFTDEMNGWVVDAASVWRTEDGGVSWTRIFAVNYEELDSQPLAIYPLKKDLVWLGMTGGRILRMADGRPDWQVTSLPFKTDVRAIYASDSLNCVVGGFGLFNTSNGGVAWNSSDTNEGKKLPILSMSFISPKIGWAVGIKVPSDLEDGSTGEIFRTDDGGQNWIEINHDLQDHDILGIKFVDKESGWLYSRKAIYVSRNGGNNWVKVKSLK